MKLMNVVLISLFMLGCATSQNSKPPFSPADELKAVGQCLTHFSFCIEYAKISVTIVNMSLHLIKFIWKSFGTVFA